jgi:hypothetical protein
MILAGFRAGLREIFLLEAARATVDDYGAERLRRVREEKARARASLGASSRIANAFVALEILVVALEDALRAADVACDARPSPALGELARESRSALELAKSKDMTFGEAEAARDKLESLTRRVLAQVESRTPTELSGTKLGRLAAVALFLCAVAFTVARHYGVHNVALGKVVTASGVRESKLDGVVDGRRRGTYGVLTTESPHPFVMIDLGQTYRIRSIRVYNRGDGWFDEVLPLSIEISVDGLRFHEVARRTEHFDVWTIDLGLADARYVRASKDGGYIALNEIEVYSRE